jgi:hypothetical protein
MNQKYKNVVIILSKKPELGKTKTRIAKDTSDSFSLKLSLAAFEDLIGNITNSDYYDVIVGTDTPEDLRWFENQYHISGIVSNIPPKENLSKRMNFAFETLLKKYEYQKAILIPMDMPFIQSEDLISAFTRLDTSSYVLGPETNGGVYLIGMNKDAFKKDLFDNIPWSTPHSLEGLVNNYGRKNTHLLKLKDDINTFQDILINKDLIQTFCPKLFNLLQQDGYFFDDGNHFVDFDTINICIPTVSAIVERRVKQGVEILLQTRNKPTTDPTYSGSLEIPSGLIERYESACKAVIREVKEEVGLDVVLDESQKESIEFLGIRNDTVIGYQPFFSSQQIRGGRSYLNLAFICHLKNPDDPLEENKFETKSPHWIGIKKLKKMLEKTPEAFFTLNIPVLKKYIANN